MTDLNRFKQILLPERLCQEFDCAPLHRLHRHWNVTMSGDEDDWQLSFGAYQFALQFQSTLAGKTDVKHQASGSFWQIRLAKLAHRPEQADPKARRSKQLPQGVPHSRIIVDDHHCWRLLYHMCLVDMRIGFSAIKHSEIIAWTIEGTTGPIRFPRIAAIGELAF